MKQERSHVTKEDAQEHYLTTQVGAGFYKLCLYETCKCDATCLGQMLHRSVQITFVPFNGGHVPVDRAGLLWLFTVLQKLQRLLTLG